MNASPAPLEPQVRWYDIRSQAQMRFLFPFQVIALGMVCFLILGWLFWSQEGNQAFMKVLLAASGLLLPLCLPGLLYYLRYFVRERRTGLEIDLANGLICYVNPKVGQHLLFHAGQVDRCVLCLNRLLPHRVDTMILFLRGGRYIEVSSLIVDPLELIRCFGFRPEVYQRWLGPFNPIRWITRGRPKNPG